MSRTVCFRRTRGAAGFGAAFIPRATDATTATPPTAMACARRVPGVWSSSPCAPRRRMPNRGGIFSIEIPQPAIRTPHLLRGIFFWGGHFHHPRWGSPDAHPRASTEEHTHTTEYCRLLGPDSTPVKAVDKTPLLDLKRSSSALPSHDVVVRMQRSLNQRKGRGLAHQPSPGHATGGNPPCVGVVVNGVVWGGVRAVGVEPSPNGSRAVWVDPLYLFKHRIVINQRRRCRGHGWGMRGEGLQRGEKLPLQLLRIPSCLQGRGGLRRWGRRRCWEKSGGALVKERGVEPLFERRSCTSVDSSVLYRRGRCVGAERCYPKWGASID
eukprot:Sspe_Gene.12403::Locus_4228_Transcript_1_1_Confidence_1.000_Length_2415::g.12403::m.12403